MDRTYCVGRLSRIPENLKTEVLTRISLGLLDDIEVNHVCVVLETFQWDDEATECMLYTVETTSEKWVSDYLQSGGQWEYVPIRYFLTN